MGIHFVVVMLIVGISGIIAQVLLLRELLVSFYGNELIIGIILANWLAAEGLGAFLLGKYIDRVKNKVTVFVIVQLVFAAVVFAGQGVALSMGLGFASMVDPQNGQQVPVVAQLYVITSTLIFLGLDGHLLLIKMLLDSFTSLPIGIDGITKTDIWAVIAWSSRMFAGGLLLAMPVIVSLLLVNIGFGVATRAAPQLNIFSVGFPVTLMLGILLIWLTLPNVLDQFDGILTDAYDLIGQLLRL